jgi:hypothetical protein
MLWASPHQRGLPVNEALVDPAARRATTSLQYVFLMSCVRSLISEFQINTCDHTHQHTDKPPTCVYKSGSRNTDDYSKACQRP